MQSALQDLFSRAKTMLIILLDLERIDGQTWAGRMPKREEHDVHDAVLKVSCCLG